MGEYDKYLTKARTEDERIIRKSSLFASLATLVFTSSLYLGTINTDKESSKTYIEINHGFTEVTNSYPNSQRR